MGTITMSYTSFVWVYVLLLAVLSVFAYCHIPKSLAIIVASLRMTAQLIVAGYVLLYVFQYPHWYFNVLYLCLMGGYCIYRVIHKNLWMPRVLRWLTGLSILGSVVLIILFMLYIVIEKSFLNPQFMIPISGMLVGSTLTGTMLGLKTFREQTQARRAQILVLMNMGARPRKIMAPFVSTAIESALLPIINNMVSMGIISMPGMMTGQILAGAMPNEAVLYQISIIIAQCTAVALSTFLLLHIGSQLLWNRQLQWTLD